MGRYYFVAFTIYGTICFQIDFGQRCRICRKKHEFLQAQLFHISEQIDCVYVFNSMGLSFGRVFSYILEKNTSAWLSAVPGDEVSLFCTSRSVS